MDEPPGSRRGAVAALALVALLAVAGLWLAQRLRADARVQDCVMAGRTNCTPVAAGERGGG